MGKKCPVCTRPVKSENPQKGDLAWEDTYCSTYCRLYDERGLEKVPFEGGNKHHKNILRWPRIPIKCDMCENEILLVHDEEKCNKRYCSRECWNKVKTSQKRGILRTLNILHYIEHNHKYKGNKWLSPSDISEKCNRKGVMCSPTSVGLILKRWREAGIVRSQLQGGSSNGMEYRLYRPGLKGMSISQFVYRYNTMSYAERIAFTGQAKRTAQTEPLS